MTKSRNPHTNPNYEPCVQRSIPHVNPNTRKDNRWELTTPAQTCRQGSVTPLEDNVYVPIEVHSHNTMDAFFSSTDNKDETGLRIYGVLGRVDQAVVNFRLRISIYGHYAFLPYEMVFQQTPEVING